MTYEFSFFDFVTILQISRIIGYVSDPHSIKIKV